jgi:Mannosylglycerate hydrolase MGH1-like glycoside hydrolase domain
MIILKWRGVEMGIGLCMLLLLGCSTILATQSGGESDVLGKYFVKKKYSPVPLPNFEEMRNQLPSPIYDANPLWVEAYWKTWELAFKNFYQPPPGSGFVSNFIDAAFNQNIFLWDSCFMSMFCNYGYPLVPGISTLDNFYAKQHEDGEICREIVRAKGVDFDPWVDHEHRSLFSRWGWPALDEQLSADRGAAVKYEGRQIPEPPPLLTLDALDHPILAWAELESYQITGNQARLEMVWEPLVHYYDALKKYLRQGNGLYVTDWASMDNSPRNHYLDGGGTGIDISSEMVLFARQLSQIAAILGKSDEAVKYAREGDELSELINQQMWDSQRGFYFDMTQQGQHVPVETVAAYWTLLARVASPDQASALVKQLDNPATFGRLNRVPTLAGDEPGFVPDGGYWRGSVWAPAETMVIRGLENYGYQNLAKELAISHLSLVAQVFKNTGTIWENYAPDAVTPGKPAKDNFVGWSGIAPIMYLLEYAIGLRPDAAHNQLVWELQSPTRTGCERYRFNGHVTSLVAQPAPGSSGKTEISVESDGSYTLQVRHNGKQQNFVVVAGKQKFDLGR